MINEWLETLSKIISENILIAPFIAFIAGVLTSFTPCSLSSIPLVIGYVGGSSREDSKKSFKLSVVFAFGMAITFTILGTLAAYLGKIMQGTGTWWYIFLGALMILMSLQIWEVFNFIPSSYAISKNNKKGYFGALIAGVLGGLFSSPCSTPVLISLLAFVAKEGNTLLGILLLLLYSIGHSILAIVAGTSVGFVNKIVKSKKYGSLSLVLKILMGIVVLSIGLYMLYLGF